MLYNIDQPPTFVKIAPFRFVKPYEHCYKTNAKARWLGKGLLEAMSDEFQAYSREYYEQAILDGKVQINETKVTLDYKIRSGDQIEHYVTRIEPPVLDIPIKVVAEDDDYVVVCKPPSMIVHTGGGYHYNCLVSILFFEQYAIELYVLHRLDRLTSGLLLLAKRKELAQSFHTANGENTVKKIYLARVAGDFPEEITETERALYCVSMKNAIFAACDPGDEAKLKNAKQAKTQFKKLWYDEISDTSLLECTPITGRTHQIRVHLSDLGYPIINDIGYGGRFVGNKILEQYFQDLPKAPIRQDEVEQVVKKVKLNNEEGAAVAPGDNQKLLQDCLAGKEEWDYTKHPLEIYLHSWKYTHLDRQFVSDVPYWYNK